MRKSELIGGGKMATTHCVVEPNRVFSKIMLYCSIVYAILIVIATELAKKSEAVKTKSNFMPSSLALYPLDFQDIWQSSEPIPVDINYSVPSYGPKDLKRSLQQLQRSTDILKEKEEERERKEQLSRELETKGDSVLSLIRDRIRYAHRVD